MLRQNDEDNEHKREKGSLSEIVIETQLILMDTGRI